MNSSATVARPAAKGDTAVTTPHSEAVPAKAPRKARAKAEGLSITFRITDADEIKRLNDLAKTDRRTPDNYIALLTYKHLNGFAPIRSAAETSV
jgi:hypothetical protein